MSEKRRQWIYFAWVIALTGAILSIYYGEILGIEPCRICWYQRVALFPLVLILGIAAYRGEGEPVRYALPLALIGAVLALYQTIEPYLPSFQFLCSGGGRCSESVFALWGFLTFPLVSALGFFLIAAFLIAASFD